MRGPILPTAAVVALAALLLIPVGAPATGSAVRGESIATNSGLLGNPYRMSSTESPPLASPAAVNWTNLTGRLGGASPPARSEAAFAYDAATAQWVLFGGCGAVCPMNDTWAFSHGGWVNLTRNGPSPEARRDAMMTYDGNAGGVLLFGGASSGNSDLNSTWLFKGGLWTNLSYLGGAPHPRRGGTLVFDPDPAVNGSTLFGGCFAAGFFVDCLNDTWVWHPGAGWSPSSTGTSPAPRGEASAVYDPSARAIVMFGGFEGCASLLCTPNDTWEFYGGNWWPLNLSSPSGRLFPALAYDAALSGDVLFGGDNLTYGNDTSDTWLFAHGAWSRLAPIDGPRARSDSAFASGANGSDPLLFGGIDDVNGTAESDTWVFGNPPAPVLSGIPPTLEEGVPVVWTVNVGGGTPPYAVTISFGDGNGSSASGDGPSFAFSHALELTGNLSSLVTVSDALGLMGSWHQKVESMPGASVSISTPTDVADVGIPIAFSVVAIGSTPWTFTWSFGDGTNASSVAQNVSHVYAGTGTFSIRVTARDADGSWTNATTALTVVPVPTVTINAPAAVAGTPATFRASLTGGSGPFTYAWRFGDGSVGSVPSPSHTFAEPGQYSVGLWVNDSVGGSTSAHVDITVASAGSGGNSTSASSTTNTPSWYWGALGLIVVGCLVASVLAYRRGTR